MKKIFLLNMAILSFIVEYAQTNFKWEKVDSVSKTKEQIYSDTKLFIAETWNSAQSVVQNDDKESGVILVRGEIIQTTYVQIILVKWVYSYTVKFLMKERKYKIILDNVSCKSAFWGEKPYSGCIDACDTCEFPGLWAAGINKAQYNKLLDTLKGDIQRIIDNYDVYMKKPSIVNSNW